MPTALTLLLHLHRGTHMCQSKHWTVNTERLSVYMDIQYLMFAWCRHSHRTKTQLKASRTEWSSGRAKECSCQDWRDIIPGDEDRLERSHRGRSEAGRRERIISYGGRRWGAVGVRRNAGRKSVTGRWQVRWWTERGNRWQTNSAGATTRDNHRGGQGREEVVDMRTNSRWRKQINEESHSSGNTSLNECELGPRYTCFICFLIILMLNSLAAIKAEQAQGFSFFFACYSSRIILTICKETDTGFHQTPSNQDATVCRNQTDHVCPL